MSAVIGDVGDVVGDLVESWRGDRPERQSRRSLDVADFDALRDGGILRLPVPVDHGGAWIDAPTSTRPIAEILRTLARADSSVALVTAMHPAVLVYWLVNESADDAWQAQRAAVFATALEGCQWGTITSEPGSGGDIARTRAVAVPAPELDPLLGGMAYRLSGDKHFGSGSGVAGRMITTALPDGSDEPAMFVLDVADRPWEHGRGMTLTAEWDGIGMAATQSHAMRLDGMPAARVAWDGPLAELAVAAGPVIACLFTAVVLGVVDEAVAVARAQVGARADTLRFHEKSEWTGAEMDHWLAVQAFEGGLRAVETLPPQGALHGALRAKQSVATLAESTLIRLGRVLGGGTYSQRSPFSHWHEDVRALGFLRPPWGLAYDGLFATSLVAEA